MSPPPPPPPPGPGSVAPLTPATPSITPSPITGQPKSPISNGAGDHTDQLMAAIRNGITLKPTKTNDRSTAAFIKQANESRGRVHYKSYVTLSGGVLKKEIIIVHGVLVDNGESGLSVQYDKSTSIDEMKDALQAELRNTLKRKIKKQDLEEGDSRKNEEIERSIEHTRNEVQLKLNGDPSPTPDTPKVNNPLKTIVDMVDKERGVAIAPVQQPAPVKVTQKKPSTVSSPSTPPVQPLVNGAATLRKVSSTQLPNQNGTTTVIQINSPSRNNFTTPVTKSNVASVNGNSCKTLNGEPKEQKSPTPVPVGKVISNGFSTATGSQSALLTSCPAAKVGASQTDSPVKSTPGRIITPSPTPVKIANGSIPTGGSATNGTAFKINHFQPKLPPATSPANDPVKVSNVNSYSNTLPRANGSLPSKATPKTSTGAIPTSYTSTVKVSISSFADRSNGTSNSALRNEKPTKYEPLTIDTTSNGGTSTTNSSPSTPKELLSPQVRSGAAAIRPSQIRTLTKAGSVVSHTDILETSKPANKLPVTLVEPAPVLTAAAAVSPPPKVATSTAPLLTAAPAKERTPLFEKANKGDAPKSPLNRWNDSSNSSSGGTARKLLLTHGRPNFTIKRSNSRQGFDVDVADSKNSDSAKPVFRILTDLEKMEQQADGNDHQQQANPSVMTGPTPQQQPQSFVSFAKDLSNAPNNHPDVVVVTKTVPSAAPTDPFLANLKDIKIDISEMKIILQLRFGVLCLAGCLLLQPLFFQVELTKQMLPLLFEDVALLSHLPIKAFQQCLPFALDRSFSLLHQSLPHVRFLLFVLQL
uniref:WH2 domain-containing protein n=1 Tax=Anopheles epiroticus TaxID=199890 RepID=A0A182PBW5_9DIPT